jgi:hypothetical protein
VNHSTVAEVRVLPEVIDFSLITNMAGVLAIAFTMFGAVMRYDHDRVARLTLLGMVIGGSIGTALFSVALIIDVL